MNKFEYKVVTFGGGSSLLHVARGVEKAAEKGLNELGAQGWRVVGTTGVQTPTYTLMRMVKQPIR